MKYGVLDFNLTVESYWRKSWNNKALLNIGDAAEYVVTEQLLKKINPVETQYIRLCISDLIDYRGEKLIVPINIAFDSYVGYNAIFENFSPDIIPIFLGISLTMTSLNDKQIEFLKNFSPIGCRDQRTYIYLKKKGIAAYLNGCTASIIKLDCLTDNSRNENKILFIDVPRKVKDYIPANLREDIVFISQEKYCKKEEMADGETPYEWFLKVIENYKSPKMIVTSRFHGAVLALANNIPVILTLEKYTYRFSWLRNYCPIYTEDKFDKIQWRVTSCDYSKTANLIESIAIQRLNYVTQIYSKSEELTSLQTTNDTNEASVGNQTLYYEDVLKEISERWGDESIEFAFWGINDNSEKLYEFISDKYPNAKLVDVYDMFQSVTYRGIRSKDPHELINKKALSNYYVIVTAYLASRVANDIFERTGFDSNRAFLCKRLFVNENLIAPLEEKLL